MSKRQQKRRLDRRRETSTGPGTELRTDVRSRVRVRAGRLSPERAVPAEIPRPPYVRGPGALVPSFPPSELADRMRRAGQAAREVLLEIAPAVRPGVTTDELDRICHEACIARGGYPSPLHYKGYPKSLCTSVNEVICHGIPDDRALVEGDIVNCDVTIYLDGVHGDHSETFCVGECDPEAARLVRVTRESLWHGIAAAHPGGHINEIGRAIQAHAEGEGFGVVRMFVGHGVGRDFHTAPSVPHYFDPHANQILEPGLTFTIEPMITAGSYEVDRIWPDGWTAVTADGSLTAQFEHALLVTPTGIEVLTLLPDEPLELPLHDEVARR
ncbi:MAG TPA: type I methionyl aminopeptidase [Acidimicrobiia bacterium]|nr:type I methionyl aminopeptidase [Acidimicrobiia bacterium]